MGTQSASIKPKTGAAFDQLLERHNRIIDETWPEWKLDAWGKQQRRKYEARRGEAGDIPLVGPLATKRSW